MSAKILTQSQLKELLHYDPLTGEFIRLVRTSNRIKVGDTAGNIHSSGYRYIRVCGISYFAHRLAFLYMDGSFPKHETDHINKLKGDNRWCNLRSVTKNVNQKNRKINANNKSNQTGVSWHSGHKKWMAYINDIGERIHLGYFDSFTDAVHVRKLAESKHNFHPTHGDKL